ncbi:SDR family NAD(P)-dependent oxidoreductase [Clostridium ihumii]|uniref:SDR family NAD(P)-dependent oxidoreductase n=1 Tax=Clostridium ihumii TaxID=1470356 RepID=UPI00058E1222|nr:SDR family oxidoreductase [Clostridium ihumii]
MSKLFDLTSKVAVIVGASSGIGVQVAKALANEGANVAILARRYDKLKDVAKEIETLGVKALPVKCDVTSEEEVKNAVNSIIKEYGKIDILFNNAGVASMADVDSLDENEWNRVMDTNVKGIFLMTKYVVPYMKNNHYGKIINTSSVMSSVAAKAAPLHAYEASKSAVLGLTRGMASSWAQYGITVNAICPGLFKTEMTEHTLFEESFLMRYNAVCPASRPGKEGELNGAVIYFASDASNYTTGQALFVDGGWTSV